MEHIYFVSGFGCGLCLGLSVFAFRRLFRSPTVGSVASPSSVVTKAKVSSNSIKALKRLLSNSEYKLVLVVRTDLQMSKGKIAAQCGHAAVGAFEKAVKRDPEGLDIWRMTGQAKVALKVDNVDDIKQIADNAKKMGLITSLIRDAGRTQIAPNSITVLGVGPAPKDVIDQVTGHLKLL